MHPLMLKAVIDACRARIAEGDCPTTKAIPVEQLEEAIVQLAAPVPAREWIPVGERLPETPLHVGPYSGAHIQRSAEVLMAYGDGLVGAGKYSATRVEGRWYRNSHRVTGITHWMPLPPPPAADK